MVVELVVDQVVRISVVNSAAAFVEQSHQAPGSPHHNATPNTLSLASERLQPIVLAIFATPVFSVSNGGSNAANNQDAFNR